MSYFSGNNVPAIGSVNTLRSGAGAPSDVLGNNGDFYIDTTNDTIYGPKTSGTWGSATSIIGPTGPAGQDATYLYPTDGFRIIEHFLATTAVGNNGWTLTANSGSVGTNTSAGSGTRMGIMRLDTLTSSVAAPTNSLGNGTSIILSGLTHTFETSINLPVLSTGSEEFILRVGYSSATTSTLPVNGVFFEYDRTQSTNWRLRCGSGSSYNASPNSSTAVSAGSWMRLKIVINSAANLATFYIDDVSIGTVSTNIPTGTSNTVSPSYQLIKTVGTTSRLCFVDWAFIQGVP
jgi:hypothetical protein